MCLGLKCLKTILMSGQGESHKGFLPNEWANRWGPRVNLKSAKVGGREEGTDQSHSQWQNITGRKNTRILLITVVIQVHVI